MTDDPHPRPDSSDPAGAVPTGATPDSAGAATPGAATLGAFETRLTELLGTSVPIVSAPMAGVAGGRLAAGVSGAGAFGMIGVGASMPPETVHGEAMLAVASGRPFGIGLMAWALETNPAQLDAAIAAGPTLVSVSFGDYAPHVRRLHDAGILVATQVGDPAGAVAAVDSGVDVIVARGGEAGGHGLNRMGTLPLLAEILDRVDSVPVLAAGGITTGPTMAAALAAGAAGVWMGTAFLACPEALNTAAARARVCAASGDDTVYTRVFDIAQQIPWPVPHAGRALRNAFTARWHGHETELATDLGASERLAAAKAIGDYDIAYIYAGQGVGGVTRERPAAEVVADIARAARRLLDDP